MEGRRVEKTYQCPYCENLFFGTEADLNTHLDGFGRKPHQWLIEAVSYTYLMKSLDDCYTEDGCLVLIYGEKTRRICSEEEFRRSRYRLRAESEES